VNPYQFVPPFNVTNEKISLFPFVLVNVGAVFPGHNTEAPHVTDRAVPSAVNMRVKAAVPVGTFVIVNVVIAAFNET